MSRDFDIHPQKGKPHSDLAGRLSHKAEAAVPGGGKGPAERERDGMQLQEGAWLLCQTAGSQSFSARGLVNTVINQICPKRFTILPGSHGGHYLYDPICPSKDETFTTLDVSGI